MVLAITPTSATAPSSELPEGLALLSHWRSVVEEVGACALPGVSVKYDTFIPCMWKAVARGFVPHEDAVGDGLRNGVTAGVDVTRLTGHRWFTNYKSALEGRDAVTRAIMKRADGVPRVHQFGLLNSGLLRLAAGSMFANAERDIPTDGLNRGHSAR